MVYDPLHADGAVPFATSLGGSPMRITSRLLTVGLLMLVFAASADAQRPQRPQRPGGTGGGFPGGGFQGGGIGGFGGGSMNLKSLLLTNTALQEELKVSDDLKAKFTKFQEAQREEMSKMQGMGSDDEAQIARLKMQIKMIEDRMAIMKDLSSEQTKRLSQIENQQMGLRAFTNDKVVEALKLSDDQKDKIKTINEELNADTRELFTAGFGQDTQRKMQALRDEAMDKAVELLTANQRKQWKDMTGEKFDMTKLTTRPMRRDN